MEQEKLKEADQEKELVVAAIYKVAALSQQIHRCVCQLCICVFAAQMRMCISQCIC